MLYNTPTLSSLVDAYFLLLASYSLLFAPHFTQHIATLSLERPQNLAFDLRDKRLGFG